MIDFYHKSRFSEKWRMAAALLALSSFVNCHSALSLEGRIILTDRSPVLPPGILEAYEREQAMIDALEAIIKAQSILADRPEGNAFATTLRSLSLVQLGWEMKLTLEEFREFMASVAPNGDPSRPRRSNRSTPYYLDENIVLADFFGEKEPFVGYWFMLPDEKSRLSFDGGGFAAENSPFAISVPVDMEVHGGYAYFMDNRMIPFKRFFEPGEFAVADPGDITPNALKAHEAWLDADAGRMASLFFTDGDVSRFHEFSAEPDRIPPFPNEGVISQNTLNLLRRAQELFRRRAYLTVDREGAAIPLYAHELRQLHAFPENQSHDPEDKPSPNFIPGALANASFDSPFLGYVFYMSPFNPTIAGLLGGTYIDDRGVRRHARINYAHNFCLIATPSEYGVSGETTFLLNALGAFGIDLGRGVSGLDDLLQLLRSDEYPHRWKKLDSI